MRSFRRVVVVAAIAAVFLNAVTVQAGQPGGTLPIATQGAALPQPITFNGFVRVIDGDTIEVRLNGRRAGIGIVGIDAPQGNTACGRQAAAFLGQLVAGGVTLEDDPDPNLRFDDHKRRLYQVKSLAGRDIDAELVNLGFARADGRGKSAAQLRSMQGIAQAAKRGCLWGQTTTGGKASSLTTDSSTSVTVGPTTAPSIITMPPGFSADLVTANLVSPTSFAMLPDGRILVAEKNGIVRLYKDGALVSTPFLDIRDRVNDYWDRGLLGIARDPAFATNGFVYLLYTYENDPLLYDGTKTARLARFTASGDVAAPNTEAVILGTSVGASCEGFPAGTDCMPSDGPSHGVGKVEFSSDGTIFLTLGDSASFNLVDDLALRAQNLDSLAGKVIHITKTGQGISTNPFWTGVAGANRSKVWAYGVRNAFRFDIEPTSLVPYVGDVGWDAREEIDAAVAGSNLGWPCYEGSGRQPGYEPKATCQALYAAGASAVRSPLLEYDHCQLFCGSSAITGGVFYTATAYPAPYRGAYIYGDYGQGFIRYVHADASHLLVPGSLGTLATAADGPVDFELGSDGNLYYLAINTGELRRLRYTSTGTTVTYLSDLSWTSATNGWGPVEKDKSNGELGAGDGRTLTLAGVTFTKGLGAHAASDIRYGLSSSCTTFTAQVGVDDEVGANGSVVFQVYADAATTPLYDSGTMTGSSATKTLSVDVTGVGTLRLVITDAGNGNAYDHADWADAKITCSGGSADTTPPTVSSVSPTDGATGAAVATNVTATFSEPMDPATISTSTFMLAGGSGPVAASVTYDVVGKMGTLNPAANLQVGVTYTATIKGGSTGAKDVAGNPLAADKVWTFTTAVAGGGVTYLSDLSWTSATNGWGPVEKDKSNGELGAGDGRTLTLAGVTFTKGLGAHAASDIRYGLSSSCTTFTAQVGVDDEVGANGSVVFQVYADAATTPLYDSGTMTGSSVTKPLSVDLTGKSTLRLVITDAGDGNAYDHADWADAKFNCGTAPPDPSGLLGLPESYSSGTNTHGVAFADLNADAKLDLLGANAGANSVSVRLGNGDGTFGPAATFGVGTTPKVVTPGDLNGDGKIDLVTANQDSDNVSVLIGNGTGQFAVAVAYATCSRAHDVAIGDFNGDGKKDLAVACWASNLVSILLGNGNGTFGAAVNYQVGLNPHSVTVADFDGDGKQDLAIAAHGSASVSILKGQGDGTFLLTANYGVGTGPHSIRSRDLNGDGKIDLVTADDGSDTASVLLGNGNGTFASSVQYATGHVPKGVAVGDLNGDGKIDLLTANTGGNYPNCCVPGGGGDTITLMLGNGDGTFGIGSAYTAGTTPFSLALADVNGDGDIDVATANWHSNDITILRNRTVPDADTFPPVVSSVSPADLATGVPVVTNVIAIFSEPMNAQTITTGTFTLAKAGLAISANVTYEIASRTATLDPAANLEADTTYTATIKGGSGGANDAAGNPLAADKVWTFTTAAAGTPTVTYLSDLTWTFASNGWGPVEKDKSNGEAAGGDGRTLTLGGVTFAKGLGAHAGSDIRYALASACPFTATIGVDDEVGANGSVVFQVYADAATTPLYDSGTMTGSSATKSVNLDVTGISTLRLVITDAGNGNTYDHADWADAKLTCSGGADTTPPTVSSVSPTDGATGAAVATNVTATFSEPMDPATISTSTFTLTKAGLGISANVTYDSASRTATLDPAAILDANTTYTATIKGGSTGAKDVAGNPLAADKVWTFTTAVAGGTTTYLSDLTWTSATNGWGPVEKDKSNGELGAGDGRTLTLNGVTFTKGLGAHAASDIRYAVNSSCPTFTAQVGVDDEVGANGSVVFQVYADAATTPLFDSGTMTGSSVTKPLSVDLTGKSTLRLVITDGGDGNAYDHADWADAKLNCANTAPVPTISQPVSTLKYKVGDVITFAGSATDAQDGTIPPSGLAWQVIIHHCPGGVCHTHPFSTASGTGGSFTAPDHGDDSYFEIILTATDSGGAPASTSVNIQPQTVQLTLTTSPAGLNIVYGSTTVTAPFTANAIVGGTRTLTATTPQGTHTFVSWSDGGAAQHNITIGTTNMTLTATFSP